MSLCRSTVSTGMFNASIFFCKQKTAYEVRISDWSSDVGSSDLCAFSLLRDPEFPPGRRGEKAQHRLTLFHQRDGHRPSPPSAQIIARAVNRVDDPYAFVAKPHQIVSRLFR